MSNPIRRLLICSLGNPPPTYLNTRHSAGHFILQRLPPYLHTPTPPFTRNTFIKDRTYRGPLAPHETYTLFSSPTLMNISGPAIQRAWKTFRSTTSSSANPPFLIILHDDLEKSLGKLKFKTTGSSNGQNGISSVISSLGTQDFLRIGIGISRPESRDSKVIADYVLGKMSETEMRVLEDVTLPKVVELLKRLAVEKNMPGSHTL